MANLPRKTRSRPQIKSKRVVITKPRKKGYYKGYNSSAWHKLRLVHLAIEPLCIMCEDDGVDVDHIKPIEDGGELLNPLNLQTMCKSCHSKKTRDENKK